MSALSKKEQQTLWIAAAGVAVTTAVAAWSKWRRSSTRTLEADGLSSRGLRALNPPIPYLDQFLVAMQNPYNPQDNATGYVPLCVAENKLITDLVSQRFQASCNAAFSDHDMYNYASFMGLPEAREAVAYFLRQRYGYELRMECLALATGCSAFLNHLFVSLGEAGDACLIPAPYYAAFENDMNVLAGCHARAIEQERPAEGPQETELEQAYARTVAEGLRPRFLLLTNPNNPLGTVYPAATVKRLVAWARSRDMHVIVDEIYALSTHSNNHKFESIIQILENDLGDHVHMLWALSKDFGASGLRVGVVYSQNSRLLEAIGTLNIFSCVPGPIQYLVSEILTDDAFVMSLLDTSSERLRASYQICTHKLDEMVLPYVPATAGMFVYVDFSSLLPEATHAWEATLAQLMFDHARVVLTPGESQRDHRAGWFRICYAWVSPQHLSVAMERLSRMVAKVRRLEWEDLGEHTLASIMEV